MRTNAKNLSAVLHKHRDEIYWTLSGKIHRILNGKDGTLRSQRVPIFVFHSVEPERFEQQLQFLKLNGYMSVDSSGLLQILTGERSYASNIVALTFDDATGSFWSTAFPLLKKYGFPAILFAIPGLIPDDPNVYPNLEDVWTGRASRNAILTREEIQPLCTWSELTKMHQSGFIDIQSHSLTHSRIHISPKVVDFLHPSFDTYFYENVNVPISQRDSIERPLRAIRLGQPVYQSEPQFTARRRFLEDVSIGDKIISYVYRNGGKQFFARSKWRVELEREYKKLVKDVGIQDQYETSEQTNEAIRLEMSRSKHILEERLNGKAIQHFCYPWYQGSQLSDQIAKECGYVSVYYGYGCGESIDDGRKFPFKVNRISEEYLFCLTGESRQSIIHVWKNKLSHFRKSQQ